MLKETLLVDARLAHDLQDFVEPRGGAGVDDGGIAQVVEEAVGGKASIVADDALCLGVGIVLWHHEVVHVTDQQAHGIAEVYLPCKVGLQLAHDGLALVGKPHHRVGEGGEGNVRILIIFAVSATFPVKTRHNSKRICNFATRNNNIGYV